MILRKIILMVTSSTASPLAPSSELTLRPFDFPAVALKAAHQGDPFVSTGMTRR